jgi:hypothetical protein
MSLEVLAKTEWSPHHGIIGTKAGSVGQLTRCRFGSITFYVRENFCKRDSFVTASNARMALKRGRTNGAAQILEVCAPEAELDAVIQAVANSDAMGRPVRTNRAFTVGWAEAQFKEHK